MGKEMAGKGGRIGSGGNGEEGGKEEGIREKGGGGRERKRGIYSEAAHCRGSSSSTPPLIQTITPRPNLRRK